MHPAAADPSKSPTPRDVKELLALLTRAGELEHILMCSYLFTAYTLKQDPSEGGFSNDPPTRQKQFNAVSGWRGAITGVAVQEMLHLALVGNLVSAIGGPVDFSRSRLQFPISPKVMKERFGYDGHAWLGLWPFADLTIQRDVWYEASEPGPLFPGPPWITGPLAAAAGPVHLVGLGTLEISTLMELYEAIANGFVYLNATLGQNGLFPPERRPFQVTDQEVTGLFNFPPAQIDGKNRPLLNEVTDLKSALTAINTIIMQGEGDNEAWEQFIADLAIPDDLKRFPKIMSPSHHQTFGAILDGTAQSPGYRELKNEDPQFDPVRAVLENPLTVDPCQGDSTCRSHVHLVTAPFTRDLSAFYDDLYLTMLSLLQLAFEHRSDTNDAGVQGYEKATLVQAAIRAMVYLASPIGNALTQLPGEGPRPQWYAGPAFVWNTGPVTWDEVRKKLYELAARANTLSRQAPAAQIWISPSYLGIPAGKNQFPQDTLRHLLLGHMTPSLIFMGHRLGWVRGHAPDPRFDRHVCHGLNACRGQDITGQATQAGAGVCATADPHVCSGQNHCRGQGGCGFSYQSDEKAREALQNHPGQNLEAGQVKDADGYYQFNPNSDSACGSPILPSLKNTYGDNTPLDAGRGGSADVYDKANGSVWGFARLLFEQKMREQGIAFDEAYEGTRRFDGPLPEEKS